MAQYSQRTQPMHRPGQSDHGHSGGALSYGGKPAGAVVAPPRPPPTTPYAPQPYPPAQLRLHQPGYGSAALSYRDGSYGRSGGAVGEYRGGGRMSLLGTTYLPPPAPATLHPPPADPPPFKKIRLTAERAPITQLTHHLPLRVDTREPVNSYNTVDVLLSPNPTSEPSGEDQTLRTTKDVLLKEISKVDREMALVENSLAKLKRKQEELQQSASKPAQTEEPEEAPSRHRSLAQCIYAENRKKAASAHGQLDHLGPPVPYPLYNQPQDTEVYHENIRKHRLFRKRLIVHIRRIKAESEKREDLLADEYTKRAAEWARRVERIEQSQKRKAKDAKNREFFEKVFPELRKQREERERFHRLGARVKSEAELEELADGLHEQEHEDKKMRALTVVPPLRRDPLDTTPIYLDTNTLIPGRCLDMKSEHKELQLRNIWSQAEREIFREKYLQHPKNFGTIASFLPRKNVRDCVRFYYLSKKCENYKQLLRKPRQRRSTRNPQRTAVETDLPAGVTTRLQRSQGARCADVKEPVLEETAGVLIPEPSAVPLPAGAAPQQTHGYASIRVELTRTPPLPPSPPPASSAPLAVTTASTILLTMAPMDSPSSIPIPASSPPPTATVLELPATTTATVTETTVTITALTSAQDSPLPAVESPVPTPAPCVTPTVVASPAPAPSPTPAVSIPSPASTPASTSPSIAATVSTSTSTLITTSPSATTVPSPASTVVVSAVVTCSPSSTPTSVVVPAVITVAGLPSGGGASGPSSAPPTPQPANPPTPTQPPPTPEAAVIERIGTPSTSVTPTTTTTTTTMTTTSSNCAVCSAPGATRTVSRSRAAHYGLKEESVGSRVCEACHCRCVRSRYTRCPVPTCPGPRVRAKRLRHLPPRWHDLAIELKRPLMDEFQIPSELSKCCLSCLKRITRRLESAGPGCEPSEDEFRGWLRDHGTAWDKIAALSGRTPATLKAYYFTYRKKLQLDSIVSGGSSTTSATGRSSSEESGSSESEGGVGSPPPAALPPAPRTDAAAPRRTRKDEYDSSATETADEENDAPSVKVLPSTSMPTPVCSTPSSTTSTASPLTPTIPCSAVSSTPPTSIATSVLTSVPGATVLTPVSGATVLTPVSGASVLTPVTGASVLTSGASVLSAASGPSVLSNTAQAIRSAVSTPQTVRDVVLNIIEFSLSREAQPPPIKTHHLKTPSTTPSRSSNDSLATLTVVNSSHAGHSPSPRSPRPTATITPVGAAPGGQVGNQGDKDGVVVLIEPRPDSLLDLTVKRTDRRPEHAFPTPNKSNTYRNSEYAQYARERESPNQYNTKKAVANSSVRVLKNVTNPKGSITLGTPVESRYEPKSGSITAGTPVHPHLHDKKFDQYYKRRSPGGPAYYATQPRPQSPSFSQSGSSYGRNPHVLEQRSIIMADFITSQQMHAGARRERADTDYPPAHPQAQHQSQIPAVLPTSHPAAHPAQHSAGHPAQHYSRREPVSVIQRHTAGHGLYPHHPPPGHEAFTSLVNVASAATALPVPGGEPKPDAKTQQHHSTHDVRLRDLGMSQKYHSIPQYQVIDRRTKQQQYNMERDIQIAMQQRRESDRPLERHESHSAHPQLIHERHLLPHVQNVSSQESRLVTSGTYSTAKHRSQTPHYLDARLTKSEIRAAVSSALASGAAAGVASAAGVAGAAQDRSGKLTAASLIDAIITHQINQTSDQRFPQQGVRECDNGGVVGVAGVGVAGVAGLERGHGGAGAGVEDLAHKTSFKLGDLASNIITRDYLAPSAALLQQHNSRFPSVSSSESYNPSVSSHLSVSSSMDEWKRRDASNRVPYLEPVSPPDNHHSNHHVNRSSSNTSSSVVSSVAGGGGGGGGSGGGSSSGGAAGAGGRRYGSAGAAGSGVMTAFDYVTTRIVEVMRSDADKLTFPTTPYAYPYSALTVGEGGAGPAPAAAPPPPAAPPENEPAPLMSAQYEPLSDED